MGVITKMDLVEPQVGMGILQNKDYPLEMGYIGVVCSSQNSFSKALIPFTSPQDSYFKSVG